MPYTNPVVTHAAGDVLSASDWNTYIRDNEAYLLSGRPGGNFLGSGYTTASAVFVDIDATNLAFTLNVLSGKVLTMLLVQFVASVNGAHAIAISVDGVDTGSWSLVSGGTAATFATGFRSSGLITGSHVFKARWKAGGGATLSSGFAYMFAIEVG